jgi:hypothetical protein
MGISSSLGSSALLPAGLGFRNLIINGHMRIAQRGTTAVSTNGSYPVDRFYVAQTTSGAWTMQQIPASTTACPPGFDYSIKFTKTTGNTPAVGDYNYFFQAIEGNNSAQLDWGTANAKPAVLSFWVRSGATGTFGGSVRNSAANSAFPFSYVVNAVDTWEYKTVYISAITTGTWTKDNTAGVFLFFDLGSGANARSTAGTVASGNFIGASGSSQYPTTTSGGNMFFTGMQLEQNYQPTPFEQRPIGVELALCQRYYWREQVGVHGQTGATYILDNFIGAACDQSTWIRYPIRCPVPMRGQPTLVYSNTASNFTNLVASGGQTGTSLSGLTCSYYAVNFYVYSPGVSTGAAACLRMNNANAYLGAEAEL